MPNLVIEKDDKKGASVLTSGQGSFGNEVIERMINNYEERIKSVNKIDGDVVVREVKLIYETFSKARKSTSYILEQINNYMKKSAKFIEESTTDYKDMDVINTLKGVGLVAQPNRHSSFMVNVTFKDDAKLLQNDLLYTDWIVWYNNYIS